MIKLKDSRLIIRGSKEVGGRSEEIENCCPPKL